MACKINIVLLARIIILPFMSSANADICSEFLKSPILTKEIFQQQGNTNIDFKSLQCSANWRSASDATNAGIDATVPIYDLPTPFTVNWNNSKIEQWKSQHCSAEERNGSYVGSLYRSIYAVNPISARAAVECIKAQSEHQSLRCSVDDNENSVIFNAEWRRTNGESLDAAPRVLSLTYDNATCLNQSDFSVGNYVIEGGNALLCKRGDSAPVFVLSTNRGKCVELGIDKTDAYVLSGSTVLDKPLFVSAARVLIKSDFKLTTNGKPVQIYATEKMEIQGSPNIVSFNEYSASKSMEVGKYASPITIKAKRITGGKLIINNAGQNGGAGLDGIPGTSGVKGAPGAGRDPITGSDNGILGKIIEAIPKSCTGGRDGGPGSRGGDGTDGVPGGPGGAAGKVTLILPLDTSPNDFISVLTGVGLDNTPHADCANRICGGLGGPGGKGGAGGPGGPGGDGASGTTWCGGTNAGPAGASGNRGKDAGPGLTGPPSDVVYE